MARSASGAWCTDALAGIATRRGPGLGDETVVFHALDRSNIESIAKIQLGVLEARVAKMDMKLEVTPAALAEIAKVGFDPVFGARPLKRAIQQQIENPVARLILEGRFGPKDTIPVDVVEGAFTFAPTVH